MVPLNDQTVPTDAKRAKGRGGSLVVGTITAVVIGAVGLAFMLSGDESEDQIVEQGRAHFAEHQFDLAIQQARRAIERSPELASAWYLLAEATDQKGQYDESLVALTQYSRLRPAEGGRLAMRLGNRWMQKNYVCPAAAAFRLSESLDVEQPQALLYQEQIAAVTGYPRETARCIIELLKRDAYTRGDLMLLTAQMPRIKDRERLEAILHADSKCKSPHLAVALDELDQSHIESAEKILLDVTSTHPDNFEAQGVLAELYAHYRPEKFISWHSKLPSQVQDDSRIWSARGKWLSEKGEISSAIRCLHESLLREPEQLSTTTLLGQLLKSHQHVELGTAFTERAKRLQKIIDLNGRLNESRSEEAMLEMIEELDATGRLWEAWSFCAIYELTFKSPNARVAAAQARIKPQLSPALPRTRPDTLPGSEFNWTKFELPDLSQQQRERSPLPTDRSSSVTRIRFDDQAKQAGLAFQFVNSCQPGGSRNILETMGAGVAVLDFDLDGRPDLYFPQGSSSPNGTPDGPSDTLYRNLPSMQFEDVTFAANISETSYSQGVAAGDFDNDGFPDLYVANFGRNRLLHNNGDGTFSDVTQSAGLTQQFWTVSCAIADLDGDGFPELFDANYVQGPDILTRTCLDQHGEQRVCRPTHFKPAPDTVILNRGDGRFSEQQAEAGLDLSEGMGMGIVVADFNDDQRLDVFVANDMTANHLLINQTTSRDQSLRFVEEAFLRNLALDEHGLSQACMGIACADINRDRQLDLLVTNFAKEANTLYLSNQDGFYRDATQAAGLRQASFEPLGFGTQFLDADQDGDFDLIVMNGHIDEFKGEEFQMKPQIFRGEPGGRFTELTAGTAGSLFDVPRLGRGMASLDWNRDGRTDFIATDLQGPVLLGVNRSESPYRSLRLKFVGTQSSRDAIGTKLNAILASGMIRSWQLTAGDGYESSNERVMEICVGDADRLKKIEIIWPSGLRSTFDDVPAAGEWIVIEGKPGWVPRHEQ
ncbi:FG-GAP-like repeat-containing protein [Schlesneria sp.]|uniref:FG-GAP-like repeat-containing protein n=1 Tax=Schlesneria sp. TaxID=2762018 RepID=UPI002EF064D0